MFILILLISNLDVCLILILLISNYCIRKIINFMRKHLIHLLLKLQNSKQTKSTGF